MPDPLSPLSRLRRLPPAPTTRFAPSPTGYLHLGHVANAVWTWGIAQALQGRVVLRIEDHDRGRSRPEYERAIIDDLAWLGLEPDDAGRRSLEGPGSPFRQSDGDPVYQAAVDQLARVAPVYWCGCSRKTIAAARGQDGPDPAELFYPGTCRTRGLAAGPGRGLRLTMPNDTVRYDDGVHGPVVQRPADQCGDLLLKDPTGQWTYQLSVVVDDQRHGVDLVVRGDDLLPSTGRQILLARLLGRSDPPGFLHHPVITNAAGVKLSKRDGAVGVRELRALGWSPERLLGEAAWRTGLRSEARPIGADRLGDLFR